MKKAILFILALFVSITAIDAQQSHFVRDKRTELDGFVWYRVHFEHDYSHFGAEDEAGNILVPLGKGYSTVRYTSNSIGAFYVKKDKYEGAYSKEGIELIPISRRYTYVILYNAGYFGVKKNGKEGVCNLQGKEIIAPIYKSVLYSGGVFKVKDKKGHYRELNVDLNTKMVVDGVARDRKKEYDGYVWYKTHYEHDYSTFGAEDKNGRTLIPIEKGYTSILYTHNSIGAFYVKKDGHEGAYARDGRELISTDRGYDSVILYSESDFFGVKKDGKKGACDLQGNEVVPPIYDQLQFLNGVYKYKDANGKWVPVPEAK